MLRHPLLIPTVATLLVASIGPSRADTAALRDGRTLEVNGFQMRGDRVVLKTAAGEELSLPATDVLEIRRQPIEAAPAQAPPAAAAPAAPGVEDDHELLPVGGVFDEGALRRMATALARRHGVDESLVLAVIQVESRYDAFAVSPRGAMGLMQLMPKTAARFSVENAFDPVANVDAGVRYLKELLERYSGQTRLALAAYNAGEEAVERHSGIPPYRETIDYVRRVLIAARR